MSIFQTKEYLALFAAHFVQDNSAIVEEVFEVLEDSKAVLLGMKPVLNGQEITDYGDINDPSEDTINRIITNLKNTTRIEQVQFDYVRENSMLFNTLSKIAEHPPTLQEVSPMILLPQSWESYLESLERVERKELKRKWKRLDGVQNEFRYTSTNPSDEDFELFIKLHKLSAQNKDQFMTEPMRSFFKDLLSHTIPGWQQKLGFLYIENNPVASIFFFESEQEILLYNSGYDPEQKYYSGGLLLTAHLIKQSIENRKQKFDFLRGNERYKYDLGGKDERLFQFVIHLTKSTSL